MRSAAPAGAVTPHASDPFCCCPAARRSGPAEGSGVAAARSVMAAIFERRRSRPRSAADVGCLRCIASVAPRERCESDLTQFRVAASDEGLPGRRPWRLLDRRSQPQRQQVHFAFMQAEEAFEGVEVAALGLREQVAFGPLGRHQDRVRHSCVGHNLYTHSTHQTLTGKWGSDPQPRHGQPGGVLRNWGPILFSR